MSWEEGAGGITWLQRAGVEQGALEARLLRAGAHRDVRCGQPLTVHDRGDCSDNFLSDAFELTKATGTARTHEEAV